MVDGVAAQGGAVSGAGRPAGAVPKQLLQGPGGFHGEGRSRQVLKGQHQVAVAVLHQRLFGWPVRTNDVGVKVLQLAVGRLALQVRNAVAPDGQHAGAQYPLHLREEAGPLKPVQGLGHGGQIEAGRLQAGAGVGGHHLAEVAGQGNGGLARTGGAVPGPMPARCHCGQPVEQGRRVGGAEVGVGAGDAAEVIGAGLVHRPTGKKMPSAPLPSSRERQRPIVDGLWGAQTLRL